MRRVYSKNDINTINNSHLSCWFNTWSWGRLHGKGYVTGEGKTYKLCKADLTPAHPVLTSSALTGYLPESSLQLRTEQLVGAPHVISRTMKIHSRGLEKQNVCIQSTRTRVSVNNLDQALELCFKFKQ